jgi:hypothetical protein
MKLTQLLITLGLVTGGIVVYDAVGVQPATQPADLAASYEAPFQDGAEDEIDPLVILEGRGDDLWREDILRRLRALEENGPAAGDPAAGADGPAEEGGEAESLAAPTEDLPFLPETDDPAEISSYDPEDVKAFRTLLEAVERQRNWERAARDIRRALRRMDVDLTDDQRTGVVKATLAFRQKFRAAVRKLPRGEENKQVRKDAFTQLKQEYTDSLNAVVPSSEADTIVAGMTRYQARAAKARDPRGRQPRRTR